MSKKSKSSTNLTYKDKCIQELIAAGYALTPCEGKVARSKGWPDTEPDPTKTPADYPHNYAIVVKEGMIVIDVDPRHFTDGDDSLKRLCIDYDIDLNTTFVVKSGRGDGGLHAYFSAPTGYYNFNDLKHRIDGKWVNKYPGVEFKGRRHYLVGPGSIHPDTGAAYKIVNGDPADLAGLPQELLTRIERPVAPEGELYIDDSPENQQRYVVYLKNTTAAVELHRGDETTWRTALKGRDMGLSEPTTYDLMVEHYNTRCSPPWDLNELRVKVANAYTYAHKQRGNEHPHNVFGTPDEADRRDLPPVPKDIKWAMSKHGIKPETINVLNILRSPLTPEGKYNPCHDLVRLNEFSNKIELTKAPPWPRKEGATTWIDDDDRHFQIFIARNYGCEIQLKRIFGGTRVAASYKSYHPLRDYLEELLWDGTERIDTWLIDYAGAEDNIYTRAVGKNCLVSAIARIMTPGCQVDSMLVLEGDQGTGKTSIVRILGGEYFADIYIDPHSNKTQLNMAGQWILESSELEFLRRAEVNALKAFLSRTTDRTVLPYGYSAEDFPRQSIFIGTVNPQTGVGYLTDPTGNRRFWPVATSIIRLDELARDRNQLWAEALVRFKKGEVWHLDTKELQDAAAAVTSDRTIEEPWSEEVQAWIDANQENLVNEKGVIRLTARQVAIGALGIKPERLDRTKQVRISTAMQVLGFKRKPFRQGGKLVKGFELEVNPPDDDLDL